MKTFLKNRLQEYKTDRMKMFYDAMLLFFGGIVFLQCGFLLYVNLFQNQNHLGYDASAYFLKAMEIAKQKTLFIDHWVDQTTMALDGSVPFAALLYLITDNIFLSFGIVNLFFDACIIILVFRIGKHLNIKLLYNIITVAVLLTPYFQSTYNNANPIGYFPTMFVSAAFYNMKMLLVLCCIKVFLNLRDQKRYTFSSVLLMVVTAAGILVSAVSSGLYLFITVLIPMLISSIAPVFRQKKLRDALNPGTLYSCGLLVLALIGVFIQKKYFGFASNDSNMILTGLTDFWRNIGSIFLGFASLFSVGALESSVKIFSVQGILYLINWAIFLFIFISLLIWLKKKFTSYGFINSIVFWMTAVNLCVFIFSYTTYGAAIFEERYLIPFFLAGIWAAGELLSAADEQNLLKQCFILGLGFCFLITNLYSEKMYNRTVLDSSGYTELNNVLEKNEIGLAYFYGESTVIEARNLRTFCSGSVIKTLVGPTNPYHWGDYTHYEENGEFQGRTAVIATEENYEQIPFYIKNKYTFLETVGSFSVYVSENNWFDCQNQLPETGSSIEFPYSPNVYSQNASWNEQGKFITDGRGGYALYGPYGATRRGQYKFTLYYKVVETTADQAGVFEVAAQNGTKQYASGQIEPGQNSITITCEFPNDSETYEFRCFVGEGTLLEIEKVEIERIK